MPDPIGKCHICKWIGPIHYCGMCDHWFCKNCDKLSFERGFEAIKELVKGKTPGCCGPSEETK